MRGHETNGRTTMGGFVTKDTDCVVHVIKSCL